MSNRTIISNKFSAYKLNTDNYQICNLSSDDEHSSELSDSLKLVLKKDLSISCNSFTYYKYKSAKIEENGFDLTKYINHQKGDGIYILDAILVIDQEYAILKKIIIKKEKNEYKLLFNSMAERSASLSDNRDNMSVITRINNNSLSFGFWKNGTEETHNSQITIESIKYIQINCQRNIIT